MIRVQHCLIGDIVSLKYPKHGNRNILRRVEGEIVNSGVGPAGRYITVKAEGGLIRSLSEGRIVDLNLVKSAV